MKRNSQIVQFLQYRVAKQRERKLQVSVHLRTGYKDKLKGNTDT